MTNRLLGDGQVAAVDREKELEELESLRLQVKGLKQELRDANDALEAAKIQSVAAVKALKVLRNVFEPAHRALQMVFGELDAAGVEPGYSATDNRREPASAGSSVHRRFEYWEAWKVKLGGKPAEFIQALLDHGRLSRSQIREATKSGWSTVDAVLGRLKGLSLIEKNGDHWSLKQDI